MLISLYLQYIILVKFENLTKSVMGQAGRKLPKVYSYEIVISS